MQAEMNAGEFFKYTYKCAKEKVYDKPHKQGHLTKGFASA